MVRPSFCDKLNVRKSTGTEEEDAKMFAYVSKHPTAAVSKKSGLGRCGKSCCRHKCSKHLRPHLRHGSFTPQEEDLIINLHAAIGSRWSIIAQQLPGRTDNDVKNYWNTKLKKKLCEMGIDHVTHKPFSQIIADYGSIGAFPKPSTQIRDFNNTFIHKTEQSPLQVSNFNTTNPSPESFLGNNHTNNTDSLDLLTQLQAITLVTQAPNCPKHHGIINQPQFCINDYSSSSSSSSSPSSIANQGWLPTSFSWRDFLLEDAVPPQNGVLQQENSEEFSLKDSSSQVGIDIKLPTDMNKEENDIPMIRSFKGSAFSADSSSFVEAMLEGEQDMFLEFPGLLEEPFFY